MKKLCRISFLLLIITSSTFSFGQDYNTKSLIDSLESYIKRKNIPGASISIVRSDTIIFEGGIGFADIEKNEKVTKDHLFRLGSVSKSFTALAILKLLHDKNIPLNTSIRAIDPTINFKNPWKEEQPITIEHLLEHTSGFDDFHLPAIYNKNDSVAPPAYQMVLSHKNSLTSRWKPGERKAYSNPGYIVLGQLLETLSGKTYDQYIKDEILTPLDLNTSGYYFKKPLHLPMAQGYRKQGNKQIPVPFTSIQGGPAGEFCSNAKDMSKYLQFMLGGRSHHLDTLIFNKKRIDRIENAKTNIAAKKGLPFGYGLGNYSIWKNGYLFNGHSGGIDGFTTRYVYSREANIGISVAINREGNANALIDEILNHLIGVQKSHPKNRITYPIPNEIKEKYSGFYEFKSPRNELFSFSETMLAGLILDFNDDTLITRSILGKAKDTLYYAGNNQFYRNMEGIPSTMVIESKEGKPAFWINENYTEMESRALRIFKFFGILISIFIFISFQIYGIIWLITRLFSKKKKPMLNHLILLGVGLSFSLMFGAFAHVNNNLQTAGEMNFNSVLFYISSFLFCLFSIFSLFRWAKLPKKKGFRFYYILTSITTIVLSVYFWEIGFIGLKLWNY